MDAERQLELEILAMAVRHPSVRPEARELLQLGLMSDPDRAALLAAVADADDATGSRLISLLETKVPGAAEVLSEAPVDERDGEPIDSQFSQLAGRLREIGLRRRITALQARLRSLDPSSDREEYDRAFAQATELRKQLERERT
jgi:hypothetical protein